MGTFIGWGKGKDYMIMVSLNEDESYQVDIYQGGKKIKRRSHSSKAEIVSTYSDYFDLSEVKFRNA